MSIEQILLLALIFVAVTAGVLGIGYAVSRGTGMSERLESLKAPTAVELTPAESGWSKVILKAASPIAKLATPETDEEISRLRARFMHAGFRKASAPVIFFTAKTLLAIALPVGFMLFERVGNLNLTSQNWMLAMLALAGLGYYLPNILLDWLTRRRQRNIFEAFPDAIDLMIVCVEAGLALDMAINRAGSEIRLRSTELADELDLVALELRVGASRDRALRNFATRTGLPEVSAFVTMLLQSDRFGTSLAESLRVHADGLRTRRRLRAEEAAAKIPLKLLFPLIFFIFPSLLLVLLGPAMIQIYRVMLPAMSGG